MAPRKNLYGGKCGKCHTWVEAGAGTLTGPPFKTWCANCLPAAAPALAATSSSSSLAGAIKIWSVGSGTWEVAPAGRLGDSWKTFKAACDANAVRARKDAKTGAWHSTLGAASLTSLIASLRAAGFVVEADESVGKVVGQAATEAHEGVAQVDEALARVDAEMAKRGFSLYGFQRDGVARLASRKSDLLSWDMGCVDGEAEVLYQRAGLTRRTTLAHLCFKFNGGQSRSGHCWDVGIPTNIRSLCNGEFHQNRVEGVLDKGVRPVVKVTLASGKSLRVTTDHEFAVGADEYRRADALAAGDVVLTNGRPKCLKCGGTENVITGKTAAHRGYCRECLYRYFRTSPTFNGGKHLDKDGYVLVSAQYDHPIVKERVLRGVKYYDMREHVLVMEKHLGRYLKKGEIVHHINNDRTDNRIENLQLTSMSEHGKHHGRSGGFLHLNGGRAGTGGTICFVPVEDRVVSVVADGEAHVYDVVCADPHRNFVANGIVVHNCGKTVAALAALPAGAPVLVISPAIAKGVWKREAAAWQPSLVSSSLKGRGSFRWPAANEMVVVNYDILPVVTGDAGQALLAGCPSGVVLIIDEAHNCKSPKAQRTVKVRAIAEAVRAHAGRTYALTATPLLNDPRELWSVLEVAGLTEECCGGDFFRFCRMMGGSLEEVRGASGRTVTNPKTGKAIKEWKFGVASPAGVAALKRVMNRITKEVALPDLPPLTYQQIDCNDLPADLRAECDEVWEKYEDDFDDLFEGKKKGIDFTEISALRAKLASAKLAHAEAIVAEYEEAGEPLVVFCCHRAPIEAIGKRPGWAIIEGGVSPEERSRIEDEFQAGRLKGVAATIRAGGVAITLTRASHCLFIDQDWTPALNDQARDRIRRIGTTKPVLVKILVAEHPLEQRVAQLLSAKRTIIGASVEAAGSKRGETVANAATVADAALAALAGVQADRDALAQVEQARETERQAYEALIATLEAEAAAEQKAADEKAEDDRRFARPNRPETAEERFERRVGSALARERRAAGNAPRRGPKNEVEQWAMNGLLTLAGSDEDHAKIKNDVGYNAGDTYRGHALARSVQAEGLTDSGWSYSVGMLYKYQGQIGQRPTGAISEAPAASQAASVAATTATVAPTAPASPATPQAAPEVIKAPRGDCGPAMQYVCCSKARHISIGCVCAYDTWCPVHGQRCHGSTD